MSTISIVNLYTLPGVLKNFNIETMQMSMNLRWTHGSFLRWDQLKSEL